MTSVVCYLHKLIAGIVTRDLILILVILAKHFLLLAKFQVILACELIFYNFSAYFSSV